MILDVANVQNTMIKIWTSWMHAQESVYKCYKIILGAIHIHFLIKGERQYFILQMRSWFRDTTMFAT